MELQLTCRTTICCGDVALQPSCTAQESRLASACTRKTACWPAGARAEAAEYLLTATPDQLAAYTLYSMAYVDYDLHLGLNSPTILTELYARNTGSNYTWSWDGETIHGGPQLHAKSCTFHLPPSLSWLRSHNSGHQVTLCSLPGCQCWQNLFRHKMRSPAMADPRAPG